MVKSLTLFIFIIVNFTLFSQDSWGLKQCIDYAVENNIDVQLQSMQNQFYSEDYTLAKYNMLPSFNGNISHGYNWGQRIDPFTNQFASERVRNNNLNLSSNVVLYNYSRIKNQREKAAISIEYGEFDLKKTKNDISIQVAQSFLSYVVLSEQLEIAKSQLSITNEQITRMQKLVTNGQNAKGDLYELEAQLATEQLNKIRTENDISFARITLINLLQLNSEEALNFSIVPPTDIAFEQQGMSMSVDEIYQNALGYLPEIKSAELRTKQSMKDVDLAKSSGMPSLNLFGSIGSGYSGANLEGLGDGTLTYIPLGQVGVGGQTVFSLQERLIYDNFETKSFGDQLSQNFNQSVGLNLSIPIFNGFSTKTSVAKAKISIEMAKLSEERIRNQIASDIRLAYTNVIAAIHQYQSVNSSLDVVQRNFDNAQKRFENGLINATSFNAAKVQLQNQQLQLLNAKFEYHFRIKIMELYQGKNIN